MTDYDRTDIPAGYDRGRDLAPDMLALWMNTLATHLDQTPRLILDLGCGTGRWDSYADKLAANADSVLARLTPKDLAEGIAALRRHYTNAYNQPVVEPIDLFVFRWVSASTVLSSQKES